LVSNCSGIGISTGSSCPRSHVKILEKNADIQGSREDTNLPSFPRYHVCTVVACLNTQTCSDFAGKTMLTSEHFDVMMEMSSSKQRCKCPIVLVTEELRERGSKSEDTQGDNEHKAAQEYTWERGTTQHAHTCKHINTRGKGPVRGTRSRRHSHQS
jgi:hypothetical protein